MNLPVLLLAILYMSMVRRRLLKPLVILVVSLPVINLTNLGFGGIAQRYLKRQVLPMLLLSVGQLKVRVAMAAVGPQPFIEMLMVTSSDMKWFLPVSLEGKAQAILLSCRLMEDSG